MSQLGYDACVVGISAACALPIGALIAAGTVTVGPEAAAVVAVAEFFGGNVAAATIAGAINGALAAVGGGTVESVIAAICQTTQN